VTKLVEEETDYETEPWLFKTSSEENPAVDFKKLKIAMSNHAPLIVSFPLGLNGAHVARHVEEETDNELEVFSFPPILEVNCANPQLRLKFAILNHAQLTVYWDNGPLSPNALNHVVVDHLSELDPL